MGVGERVGEGGVGRVVGVRGLQRSGRVVLNCLFEITFEELIRVRVSIK